MDTMVLDFFNYSLKGEQFDITTYNTYDEKVVYQQHPQSTKD
jgi:hypothetical protein